MRNFKLNNKIFIGVGFLAQILFAGICDEDIQKEYYTPELIIEGHKIFVQSCNCNCTGNGNSVALFDFTSNKVVLALEQIRSYRILPFQNGKSDFEVSLYDNEEEIPKIMVADTFRYSGEVFAKITNHSINIRALTSNFQNDIPRFHNMTETLYHNGFIDSVSYVKSLKLYKEKKPLDASVLFETFSTIPTTSRSLSSTELAQLNDYGFFLLESLQYQKASEVLLKVLIISPFRTPAYLNLADAYTGLGKTAEAKKNYLKYIELMKSEGKKKKIPVRVLEAVK